MERADVIYLIAETPAARGVFEKPETKERMVFTTVRSVGMRETYEAMAHDMKLEAVFELSDRAEYEGEKLCRWDKQLYEIVRTYDTGNKFELTVKRSDRVDV